MIHSAIHDNWDRVQIMHSMAYDYYCETKDSELRQGMGSSSCEDSFAFNAFVFETMRKEACLVEAIMVWSVIAIETLINHVLAEVSPDELSAKNAIEYPDKRIDKRYKKCHDLVKKLIILNDGKEINDEILLVAENLSENRNAIVHDKPFELNDYGDGEVKIINYSLRENEKKYSNKYEDLKIFFKDCDKIKDYIFSASDLNGKLCSYSQCVDFSFSSLIIG